MKSLQPAPAAVRKFPLRKKNYMTARPKTFERMNCLHPVDLASFIEVTHALTAVHNLHPTMIIDRGNR
jgi:hypothetical protein